MPETTEPQLTEARETDSIPERLWVIKSQWGLHPQWTMPTKSKSVQFMRVDSVSAHAPHTEEAGEVCTDDCQGCLNPVAALVADRNEARTLAFERGKEIAALREQLAQLRSALEPLSQNGRLFTFHRNVEEGDYFECGLCHQEAKRWDEIQHTPTCRIEIAKKALEATA